MLDVTKILWLRGGRDLMQRSNRPLESRRLESVMSENGNAFAQVNWHPPPRNWKERWPQKQHKKTKKKKSKKEDSNPR